LLETTFAECDYFKSKLKCFLQAITLTVVQVTWTPYAFACSILLCRCTCNHWVPASHW